MSITPYRSQNSGFHKAFHPPKINAFPLKRDCFNRKSELPTIDFQGFMLFLRGVPRTGLVRFGVRLDNEHLLTLPRMWHQKIRILAHSTYRYSDMFCQQKTRWTPVKWLGKYSFPVPFGVWLDRKIWNHPRLLQGVLHLNCFGGIISSNACQQLTLELSRFQTRVALEQLRTSGPTV